MARRLKTINDCRRYLARIITDLEARKIDPQIAGRIMYGLNILAKTMEISFQQDKLNSLVERIELLEGRE